jgi:alpha-1,2-mannosyltransferase
MPAKSRLLSGNHGVPDPAADREAAPPADGADAGLPVTVRLRRYWLTPTGVTVILATALALGLRVFVLTRPGLLTGVTEYDDGVYLGGAIRLTEGALPYRDFAFVQPPGILLLMTPVALVGRIFSSAAALGLARILTVCASTACVPLAGHLTRYRGTVATVVTCGFLAVYPDDVWTGRTLLLEPWMNLCCLLAVNAAFSRGRLTGPGRLAVAGAMLGLAGTVKFWAAAPAAVLLVTCLITRKQRPGRVRAYLAGLAAGFVVPIAPFVLAAPQTFVRSTLFEQASRVGTTVPLALRLAHVTGLIDLLNTSGRLAWAADGRSMFLGVPFPGAAGAMGWLPYAAVAILAAAISVGYTWPQNPPSQLEWFVLAVAVIAAAAVFGYSAFFYHYSSFVAPWLALALGAGAARLADLTAVRLPLLVLATAVILAAAVIDVHELAPLKVPDGTRIGQLIPPGTCVVADEASDLISADRFNVPSGCPDVIDSLATTLAFSNGISIQDGAGHLPAVVDGWQSILSHAQYVLLSPGSARRIPASAWFQRDFRPVSAYQAGIGQLWERRS